VVWVDAHTDINYQVENTRNYHGMPVAHLMGLLP
jgi:arginase